MRFNIKDSFKSSVLNNSNTYSQSSVISGTQIIENTISKTFMWMSLTLLIAFGTSLYISYYNIAVSGGLYILSAIGGFGLVVAISFLWQKLNYTTLAGLLLFFGFLEGIGLSGIFLMYNLGTIFNVFAITAGMFTLLSIMGYVLKIDISKFGPILFAGLIALIIGFIVNMFWQNGQFNVILNVAGIIIFSGIIIYDMQLLKEMALVGDKRIEILMALSLFLSFINIFLMLLELIANRD